jgi:hypothetical protein
MIMNSMSLDASNQIKTVLLIQSLVTFYAFALMINGFSLLIIESLLTSVFQKKFDRTLFSFLNLAPADMVGYRKYLINILGYCSAPITLVITTSFTFFLIVFVIGYMIYRVGFILFNKIKYSKYSLLEWSVRTQLSISEILSKASDSWDRFFKVIKENLKRKQ